MPCNLIESLAADGKPTCWHPNILTFSGSATLISFVIPVPVLTPWCQLGGKLWMWSWPAAVPAAACCSHQAWTFMQSNEWIQNGLQCNEWIQNGLQCNEWITNALQCNQWIGNAIQCKLLTPTPNFYAIQANEWIQNAMPILWVHKLRISVDECMGMQFSQFSLLKLKLWMQSHCERLSLVLQLLIQAW